MSSDEVIHKLITASHILHYHNVLDAFGHISVRSPDNPQQFYLARDLAPALITSDIDIVVYHVKDAQPVAPYSPPGYAERFIHSEIYKKNSWVNSIVHSHDPEVLPFAVCSENALYAVTHMAGFMDLNPKLWDIREMYETKAYQGQPEDVLVKDEHLGRSFAKEFHTQPSTNMVLMSRHGYTATANSVENAVYRAIQIQQNAKVHHRAKQLRAVLRGLSFNEKRGCREMNKSAVNRAWPLWVREVETCPLYRHDKS